MAGERTARSTAAGLVGPATLYVGIGLLVPLAILLRYSLNQFVPGKFMVDALTVENYVKFFTDAYYTAVLWRTVRTLRRPRFWVAVMSVSVNRILLFHHRGTEDTEDFMVWVNVSCV